MSDFQEFLDKALAQIDVESIKAQDIEVYEYDIYKEITPVYNFFIKKYRTGLSDV